MSQENLKMVSAISYDEDNTPYLQIGPYKLQLEIEDLHGEFLERASKDLRETVDIKEDAIEALRKLLENEEDLVIPKDENDFLLKFLRPCKFYHESAFKLMKKYYKFKVKYPKYSQDLVPSALKEAIGSGVANFMPCRDKTGCRIMIVNIGRKWNPKEIKVTELFRAVMMFIEIAMAEPKTQVGGVQVIFDMDGLSMNQVYQFGPGFAKALLEWVQECIPLRLRGIHIINEPRIFSFLFAIFKPFINEKLRRRIIFHGDNFDKMVESFGANVLPVNYGGTMEIPEYPAKLLAELLCHYEDQFQKANEIGYITNNNKEKISS